MSILVSVLAKAIGCLASAWHKRLAPINARRNLRPLMNIRESFAAVIGRAAGAIGTGSLIVASLVLATTVIPSGTSFAAPVGAVGPSPVLKTVSGDDPPITFNFNVGGYVGTGSVMSDNVGGGNFLATSGTLTMASPIPGSASNTYCLFAAAPPPGSVSTSPLGAFLYDNVVAPGTNPAFPTIYGLLFSNRAAECGAGYSGQDEINIWATNAPPGTPGHYSFYNYRDGTGYTVSYDTPANGNDSFNATTVTITYSYTGRAFNRFQCATSPTPDCTSPGTGNPYGTSNSVTGSLQMAAPLCAPGSCSSTPINVLCGPNFVAMNLNDGLNTISVDGSRRLQCRRNSLGDNRYQREYQRVVFGRDRGRRQGHPHAVRPEWARSLARATPANGCYPNSAQVKEQDYGQFSQPLSGLPVYGYNLASHGSFTPAYTGGTATAGDCRDGQSCTLVPGNTFTIKGPNAGAIPDGAILTEQECVVPADPRGANCGATNGHLPRSLNVSDLPQCKGFGNEVIPDYLCGASGSSGVLCPRNRICAHSGQCRAARYL